MGKQQMKLSQGTSVYLSVINPNTYTLVFDESVRSHVLTLSLKNKVEGVCCRKCKDIFDGYGDKIYFCERDYTILCKRCVLYFHHVHLTMENSQHFDFKVKLNIEYPEEVSST